MIENLNLCIGFNFGEQAKYSSDKLEKWCVALSLYMSCDAPEQVTVLLLRACGYLSLMSSSQIFPQLL